MSEEQINRVMKLVSDVLQIPVEDIQQTSSSDDFSQWDSLGHLTLCMAVEEEFNIKIPMEQMPELSSIQAIGEFLSGSAVSE